jgi:hypothetical protein
MFWLSRKKFVGSYVRFNAVWRSYVQRAVGAFNVVAVRRPAELFQVSR